MGIPSPQTVKRHGVDLKLSSAAMSESDGTLVQDDAETLIIHPITLIRWRINNSIKPISKIPDRLAVVPRTIEHSRISTEAQQVPNLSSRS